MIKPVTTHMQVDGPADKQGSEQHPTATAVQPADLSNECLRAESMLDKNSADRTFDIRNARNQEITLKVARMGESRKVVEACRKYIENIKDVQDTHFTDANDFIDFIIRQMGGKPGMRAFAEFCNMPLIGSIEDLMPND